MNDDPTQPTGEQRTDKPNLSNEKDGHGNAQRPTEHLDRDRESGETIPRKSSLL